MAAQAVNCPACGSLLTATGADGDAFLTVTCLIDGTVVSVAHVPPATSFGSPGAAAPPPAEIVETEPELTESANEFTDEAGVVSATPADDPGEDTDPDAAAPVDPNTYETVVAPVAPPVVPIVDSTVTAAPDTDDSSNGR